MACRCFAALPARALLHQVEVPPGLYAIMRCAPLVVRVRASEEARVQLLMEMYSRFESLGTALRGALLVCHHH